FERLRPRFEQVLSGQMVCYEDRIFYAGIGHRWISAVYTPTFNDQGECIGWVAVVNDIEERKQIEDDVRESEESFHVLADNISHLAWTCNELGIATWYNRRWYDYTGTTAEEMAGAGWKKVHHPDHIDRVVANIEKALQTGETWEEIFPLRSKDGNYRWFL